MKTKLFNSADLSNVESDHMIDDIRIVVTETMLKEFIDKKIICKHLLSNNSACS